MPRSQGECETNTVASDHQNFDRRTFLGSGIAAGSSLPLLSSRASAAAASSAGNKLTVAVAGVRGQGLNHVRNFASSEDAEVAYICDVDERVIPRAVETATKHQGRTPAVVKDLRTILDDASVDVLSIATPNHWHAPAAIMACAAGKHVYVEKPCSYSAEEGELAVEAAGRYGRVVQMGNQRRSCPLFVDAIKRIHDGIIGPVLLARTWYFQRRSPIGVGTHVEPPKELDFHLWQGPAPERPYKDNLVHYNWHWHWHWGNGELGNNGIHAIDVARWGMQVDFPSQVVSSGSRMRLRGDQETPDTHSVAFHFDDRIVTWEGVSWSPYGPGGTGFGIAFHGESGTMILQDNGYEILDMKNKTVERVAGELNRREHYWNFLSAIRNNLRPSSDIAEAHKSTLLCHLGNIAHRTGATLRTNPENGRILDNDQAQSLWSRGEYRAGFDPHAFL